MVARYKVRAINKGVKGISEHLPKPNVVRIEPLPYEIRKNYMGGFYSLYEEIKNAFMTRLANGYEPFYGILSSDFSPPSFGLTGMWSSSTMGSPFNSVMQLAKDAVDVQWKKGGKKLQRITDFVNHSTNTVTNMMGLNTSATGSCTIKKLGNPKFTLDVPLNFKYYMPEQSEMFRVGLQKILRMAYLRPADASKENIQKMVTEGSQKLVNSVVNGLNDATKAGIGNDLQPALKELTKKTDELLSWVSDAFVNDVGKDFFGMSITVNPVPVRVSIGHYYDLQPMVINSVSVIPSKEQYIAEDGTHIPMFMSLKISLSYWLNPDPSSEFFTFIGDDVFSNQTYDK